MFYQTEHMGTSDFFKKERGENFSYPLHLHRSFELILVEDGEMTVCVDSSSCTLKKGDAALIFPHQLHALSSHHSAHTLFIFSPRIIQTFFAEKAGKLPSQNRIILPDHINSALKALTPKSSKYEIKGILYTVCSLFDTTVSYHTVENDKQELLFKILSHVEGNFKTDCTLNALAAAIGYNPEYLSRFFKKKMGMTYNEYINMRRLSYAAYLLTDAEETCLYCAMESGYTSLRSFNRNFKKHFGITPREYKEQQAPIKK